MRARENKEPSEMSGSVSSLTGHVPVPGLTVLLEGAVGNARSENVPHFLGK